jgi:hypothetical protein
MLGRRDAALNLLDHLAGRDLAGVPLSLSGGLAGIGLNLLHFAERTGQRGLRDAALNVADRLSAASAALPYGDRGSERKPRAGLMHGAAGRALFFIRLYQAAGDKAFLDMARSELYRDLDRCTAADDGTLQVDEGWRLMPYLEGGSAGIALVLDEYLDARPDARFEQAIGPIAAAAQPEFTAGSGLFNGRAGAAPPRPSSQRSNGICAGSPGTLSATGAMPRSPVTSSCACRWTWPPARRASCSACMPFAGRAYRSSPLSLAPRRPHQGRMAAEGALAAGARTGPGSRADPSGQAEGGERNGTAP